jgi:hypothetical protein
MSSAQITMQYQNIIGSNNNAVSKCHLLRTNFKSSLFALLLAVFCVDIAEWNLVPSAMLCWKLYNAVLYTVHTPAL